MRYRHHPPGSQSCWRERDVSPGSQRRSLTQKKVREGFPEEVTAAAARGRKTRRLCSMLRLWRLARHEQGSLYHLTRDAQRQKLSDTSW